MEKKQPEPHRTDHEIAFIDGLGTGEHQPENPNFYKTNRRLKLLKKYLMSTSLRKNWYNLDQLEIINHTIKSIKREEAKCGKLYLMK